MTLVNISAHFDANDIRILRRLAETVKDQRLSPSFTQMAEELAIDRSAMVNFVMRLYPLKLAYGHTNETFRVTPLLVDSLHAFDNKAPEDRWKKAKEWFFSRWWSVPVMIAFVVPPAFVGWVIMLKTLLDWITSGK